MVIQSHYILITAKCALRQWRDTERGAAGVLVA